MMYKLMTDPRKFKRSGAKVKVSAEKVIAVENCTYSRTVEHQGKTYDVQTEMFTKNGEIVKYESTFTPRSILLNQTDCLEGEELCLSDLSNEELIQRIKDIEDKERILLWKGNKPFEEF